MELLALFGLLLLGGIFLVTRSRRGTTTGTDERSERVSADSDVVGRGGPGGIGGFGGYTGFGGGSGGGTGT
jgi:hypothetical protein